jgi:CRISPR-associated protein Cas1
MKVKTVKIALESQGSYFGMEKGCFVVKDREGNTEKYPLFESEIGEIQIRSGNTVSSGALASCGFWGIDCIFLTQKGRPVAMLKSLELDDANVKTRLQQYESFLDNEKAEYIAKQLILGKLAGQNQVLSKYGLKRHDFSIQEKIKNLKDDDKTRLRTRLMSIEGHFSDTYFSQILSLVPNTIRPETRKTWKAFDGFNNILNLCYEVLSWKVHHALIKAKLEPYLGFLHSLAEGKPSLICDFMELYRYLIDDFVIQHCMRLQKKDFIMKTEDFSANRKGKREYLNDKLTHGLMKSLNDYFKAKVEIPRIRMGNSQEIETLINEEALLFAMYLRNERQAWIPRVVNLN